MADAATNSSTAYAGKILLDEGGAPWPRMPFIVRLSDQYAPDFKNLEDVLKYTIGGQDYQFNNQYHPNVVSEMLAAHTDGGSQAFRERPFLADTRLGWNDAINVLWQFNRDDDIIHPINMSEPNHGMGRVYSEMIERHQQLVWFTFGVPEFSGMLDFYMNSINLKLANLMRSGGGGLINEVASIVGTTAGIALKLPFMPFVWLNQLMNFKKIFRVTKYYDFKATMPLYYQFVTGILSHLAINMGFVGGFTTTEEFGGKSFKDPAQSAPLFLQKTNADIYKILTQRGKYKMGESALFGYDSAELLKNTTPTDDDLRAREKRTFKLAEEGGGKDPWSEDPKSNDFEYTFIKSMAETAFGALSYVGFRIEKSTDSSESFSNNTGESPLAQRLNSQVAEARDNAFSMAGGKTGLAVADAVIETGKSFMEGLASMFGGEALLNAYAGSAYLDIPEIWQSSSFGKSYSFDMQLRSPYGDPISIYQSIYVPLAMILAAALPRAAGRNSYTSPFLLRAYSRGMFSIPLGIIESISVRRGSSEFGWNIGNLPTQVDISFTIKDLSPAIYMALGTGNVLSDLGAIFAQNSSFQEYMLTLSGIGLADRVLFFRNLERKFDTLLTTFRNTYVNPLYWANRIGDSTLMRGVSNFFPYNALPNN